MKKSKSKVSNPKKRKGTKISDDEKTCFIISPIGKEGTETHNKFKEVLDYVIRPAISSSGYKLRVTRADDIERAGSFIKDILEYVAGSFVVIADLTDQNPNVFYELGVRHSLSPRTVLIAHSLEDIPADLRDYRTIIYDTTAKGAILFRKRLTNYLTEIFNEPSRADNPVLDRLNSVIETQTADLKSENVALKAQISKLLKEGVPSAKVDKYDEEPVSKRMEKILKLSSAVEQDGVFNQGSFVRIVNDERTDIALETVQGNFQLYFRKRENKVFDFWYVSIREGAVNIERELADIRILLEDCYKYETECTFIIVTDDDLSPQFESIQKMFNKMKVIAGIKAGKRYQLEIWDKETLLAKEKELGIKIDI